MDWRVPFFPLRLLIISWGAAQARSTDTVGLITTISHVKTVLARGVMKPVRNIKITDGRDTATVAIWGSHAEQFDAQKIQSMSTQGPVVALFVAVTVNTYEGQLSLQGSTICKWYPNIPIPEVTALQNSFAGIPHNITWFGQNIEQSKLVTTTVAHLSTLNAHDAVGHTYNVDIIIEDLAPDDSWWYLGCGKCKKATVRVGEGYKCPRCNAITAEPRYKMAVCGKDIQHTSKDEDPLVEFVFFGDMGQELIGVPVLTLTLNAPDIPGFIPPEITRLYGKQYRLKVSGSRGSLQRKTASFQVNSFSILPVTAPALLSPIITDKFLEYPMPIHDPTASSSTIAPVEHCLSPAVPLRQTMNEPTSVQASPLLPIQMEPHETTPPSTPTTDPTKSVLDYLTTTKRPRPDDLPSTAQPHDDTSAVHPRKKKQAQ